MDFQTLSFIFNRSIALIFSKKKLFFVFCALALCGLLVVFFGGFALNANQWVKLSLTFLPIFICTGIMLAMGILLIRIYHDDIKQKEVDYRQILSTSWEVMMGASYFAIPIIFSYLFLWILLGVFILLSEIPFFGGFFNAIFSFIPFLINLGTIALCLVSLAILFYIAPLIALRGLEGKTSFELAMKRLEKDLFGNLILLLIGILPLVFFGALLVLAVFLTEMLCKDCQNPITSGLRWFFIMLPFAAFLTPSVIFFFNFAAEGHVLMLKRK